MLGVHVKQLLTFGGVFGVHLTIQVDHQRLRLGISGGWISSETNVHKFLVPRKN